jgi:general secretion pathway protein K
MGRLATQRGVALVLVLWVGTIVTVVVAALAMEARSGARVARNSVGLAQAEALAEAGLARAVVGLLERDETRRWRADGRAYAVQLPAGEVQVVIRSEGGKIDLNAAPAALVRGVFEAAAKENEAIDLEAAQSVAAAVLDWRDADDHRLPGGAEASDYRALGLSREPANGAFLTLGELQHVLGMSPQMYRVLAPHLTVHGASARLDAETVSRMALLAVPGLEVDDVDTFIEARNEWVEEGKLDKAGFPAQQLARARRYVARGRSAVYSIDSRGTTPDGVSATRRALIRLTGQGRRPFQTLAWSVEQPAPAAPRDPSQTLR